MRSAVREMLLSRLGRILALSTVVLVIPRPALAVLPPDLIFSVGSQIAQTYAVFGAIVLGSILSIVPALRAFFSMTSVRIGAAIVLAVGGIALYANILPSSLDGKPVGNGSFPVSTSTVPGHRFFSDRFVFVGKRIDGSPVAFDIYANRKEDDAGTYLHFYSASALDGPRRDDVHVSQYDASTSVVQNLLFSRFVRTVAPDHSSREAFSFSFEANRHRYEIETGELVGDFITKNEPENTEYLSTAQARVTDGTEVIAGNLLYQRIYSTDFRPTLYFDGYGILPSEATQVVLWDDTGAFYLADHSEVFATSTAYSSHYWGLTKRTDGSTKKAFSGTLSYLRDSGATFVLEIPDFGVQQSSLRMTKRFAGSALEGFVEGTLIDEGGTHSLSGVASYQVYGSR